MSGGRIGGLLVLAVALAGARLPSDDDEAGVRGRAELAALVTRSLDQQAEPKPVELGEKERVFTLALTAIEGRGLRVLATGGAEEAQRAARLLGAARELFSELGGAPAQFPPGLCAYLLASSEARDTFLQKHPQLGPEARARLAKLESSGVEGTADWAFWQEDSEKRLDAVLRLAFDWLVRARGVTLERHTWLHEGLGFYLTHALCGTYLTWLEPISASQAGRDPDNTALRAQMSEPGADWLVLARGLFAPARKFDLEELLHLAPRELDPADYLRLHALAAFLVEVARPALPAVLTRVGAGDDPRAVLEEATGCPLEELRTRLDAWLEHREELVARAEGRRTDAELTTQWRHLNAVQKRAAVVELTRALSVVDSQQLRWLRALTGSAPAEIALAPEPPFYDPKVHAPAQPIARKRLATADSRVKRLLKAVRKSDARAPILAYDYDWFAARVVRTGDASDPETVFHNALLGLPPGADLARALVLAAFDDPEERKVQAAFAHAYTDREGNVFPLTLYEMWCTGEEMEMPDVDTLGIVHDVRNEWNRWVAPVPGEQHDALYKVIGDLFADCRSSRELRLSLAELYLSPSMTPRKGYESLAANLQALWAAQDSSPAKLAAALPKGKDAASFLTALVAKCKQDYKLYGQGRRRAATLRQDGAPLRKALGAALEAAAAAPAPAPEETPGGGH